MQYALYTRDRYKALSMRPTEDLSPIRMRLSQTYSRRRLLEQVSGQQQQADYSERFRGLKLKSSQLESERNQIESSNKLKKEKEYYFQSRSPPGLCRRPP